MSECLGVESPENILSPLLPPVIQRTTGELQRRRPRAKLCSLATVRSLGARDGTSVPRR